MRETPQKILNFMKKTTRYTQTHKRNHNLHVISQNLTPFTFGKRYGVPHLPLCSVTMSLTRGQYAWFSSSEETHKMENHQRLNVEKHSPNWCHQWLVGLVDGDGCFSIDKTIKSNGHIVWNLVFKISQKNYNKRALIKAKNILGAGKFTSTSDGMETLRIRDRKVLHKHVFPIFDKFPLLTNKHYDYVRLRQIARLL